MNLLSHPISFRVHPDGRMERLPDMLRIDMRKVFGHVHFGRHWWEPTPYGLQFCQEISRYDGKGQLESREVARGDGYLTVERAPAREGFWSRAWRLIREMSGVERPGDDKC